MLAGTRARWSASGGLLHSHSHRATADITSSTQAHKLSNRRDTRSSPPHPPLPPNQARRSRAQPRHSVFAERYAREGSAAAARGGPARLRQLESSVLARSAVVRSRRAPSRARPPQRRGRARGTAVPLPTETPYPPGNSRTVVVRRPLWPTASYTKPTPSIPCTESIDIDDESIYWKCFSIFACCAAAAPGQDRRCG